MKYAITRKDWDERKNLLDAKVLAAFGGRIGCPGCVDEMVVWVAVEFSDGTKRGVAYNEGNAPPLIAALFEKIRGHRCKAYAVMESPAFYGLQLKRV